MPRSQQDRMQQLMDKNNLAELYGTEQAELESLVEQGQKLMLRKGKAAALLTERGYTVTKHAVSEYESS
jgi:NADP-dependent 3-hydroxy acid dehydrogenase YdfG